MHIAGPKLGCQAISVTRESNYGVKTALATIAAVNETLLLTLGWVLGVIHTDDQAVLVLPFDQGVLRTK